VSLWEKIAAFCGVNIFGQKSATRQQVLIVNGLSGNTSGYTCSFVADTVRWLAV
jgi:hypothetical protein